MFASETFADHFNRLLKEAPSPAVPAGLDELRALSEKATPGPWTVDEMGSIRAPDPDDPTPQTVLWFGEMEGPDTDLAVAAANYVRAAIARAYEAEP